MFLTIIPLKLYLTLQHRSDAHNESGLLGFVSPYTKDKAFEKRKKTQDVWAYGPGVQVAINGNDEITVTGSGPKSDAGTIFVSNCYPKLIDNQPISGFEIAKSVRRSEWSGTGNVKWRISDPRGFDIEISSENFANVVNCATIINGVIQGKCCWGRLGGNNVLLPESSEPYNQARIRTNKLDNPVSIKDIKPGNLVEVLAGECKNQTVEYKGAYYVARRESLLGNDAGANLVNSAQKLHFFQNNTDNKIYMLPTPKIGSVNGYINPEPPKKFVDEVNKKIGESRFAVAGPGWNDIMFVSEEVIDLNTIKLKLIADSFEYAQTVGFPKRKTPWAGGASYPALRVFKDHEQIWISDVTSWNNDRLLLISSKSFEEGRIKIMPTFIRRPVKGPYYRLVIEYNNGKQYILNHL